MRIELPDQEGLKLEREISIIDAVKEYVIKKLYKENRVSLSVDDIRNITTIDEIGSDDIELITDSLRESENGKMTIDVYTEGESGEEIIEFTICEKGN